MSFLIDTSADQAAKAEEQRNEAERRRRQAFNNFQFEAHVAQERMRQVREEFYLLGKGRRAEKEIRNSSQPLGHHWFGGGTIPDSHVVGSATAPELSIIHPLTGDTPVPPQSKPEEHDVSHAGRQQTSSPISASAAVSPITPTSPRPGASSSQSQAGNTLHGHHHAAVYQPIPEQNRSSRSDNSELRQTQQLDETSGSRTPRGGKVMPSPYTVERPAATPPYAEHFPTRQVEIDHVASPHFVQGIPRGLLGIDFETGRARDAQRMVEQLKTERQSVVRAMRKQQLKADLDRQIAEKSLRRAKQWEEEATQVYGEGLRIGWDADARVAKRKEAHRQMMQAWAEQAHEQHDRRAAEDKYYQPAPDDWEGMQRAMDEARQRDVASRQGAGQEWLRAWQEHKAVDGAVRKAAEVEQIRREMLELGPSISNYSDRILLAERQKREGQQMYRKMLEMQVQEKDRRRKQSVAEEFSSDLQLQYRH